MEPRDIDEGNILIAKFMGAVPHGEYENVYRYAGIAFTIKGITYERDWNWIRPVIEKIHDECSLHTEALKFFERLSVFSTIDQLWSASIEYIKWYNQQKGTPQP